METPSDPAAGGIRRLAAMTMTVLGLAALLGACQIRTSDSQLRAAITRLTRAYQAFYASNGASGSAKAAVASASKRIDAFCPGAAS
jgi:hypothetical protein